MNQIPNFFALHYKVEDMIIDEDINLVDIYKLFKENFQNNKEEKRIEYKNKLITFYGITATMFNFKINEKEVGKYILKEPFKLQKETNLDFQIDIVSHTQIGFIIEQTNISTFFCTKEGIIYNLNLFNLYEHKDDGHKCILKADFHFQKFNNQKEMDVYSQKYSQKFINKTFRNIEEFEKNYRYYFKLDKQYKLDNTFEVFEDMEMDRRQFMVNELLRRPIKSNFNYFYGASGIGKTVTLIGALKYSQDKYINTLYINCKALRFLIGNNDIELTKQILIDEIFFLFPNNYKHYEYCFNLIRNFRFKSEYDFWPLTEKIMDYASNSTSTSPSSEFFIIAFDQYNIDNDNDIYNHLKTIRFKFQNNFKFKILVFSSMDEFNIRGKKLNFLFGENYDEESQDIYYLCKNFITHFDEKEMETFIRMGKTLKSYNEILQIKLNNSKFKTLDEYIIEKKDKIMYKIYLFYEGAKIKKNSYRKDKMTDYDISKHAEKILSFIPKDKEYTLNEIKTIIDNVPFKYFNIINKENNKFIIEFCFPLLETIFIEIYKKILLKRNFSFIKNITKGSGAFDHFFAFTVIFNIIEQINNDTFSLFNTFRISQNLTVKKLVLNKNESIDNIIVYKRHILNENYQYIIDQEVFCGKALDFIIIRFINYNPYVYGFKVSVYKKKIYEIKDIQESYESMKILLKKYFNLDFNKYYMFFGYIFDYERVNNPEYISMLYKCDINNLKYCFYDPIKCEFKDKNGNLIQNIDDIVTKEFSEINKIDNSPILYDFDIKHEKINIKEDGQDLFKILNENQKKILLIIIRKRYGPNAYFVFMQKGTLDNLIIDKYHFYISKLDFSVLNVVFFQKKMSYNLYYDGTLEEAKIGNIEDDLYIFKIKFK